MSSTQGSFLQRRWLDFYLLFVGITSTLYGIKSAKIGSGWAIGEWLINYSAGFIRRGLIGEILLHLGHLTHIGYPWLVLLVQVSAYTVFLWTVHLLTSGVCLDLPVTFMLLSPATLAFIVLDPPSGFKKEILLFAILGASLSLLFQAKKLRSWQLSIFLTIVLTALVLSHEPLLVFLPYLFAALLIVKGNWKEALRISILPSIAVVIAAAAVARHPGNESMAQVVCNSVGGKLPRMDAEYDSGLCSGGISWLGMTMKQAHAKTMDVVRVNHYFRLYGLLAIPSLAPMIWVFARLYYRNKMRNEVCIAVACAVVSMAASSLLFYSAMDWGRWIHIHAVCLMMVCLVLNRVSWQKQAEPVWSNPFTALNSSLRPVAALALLLWATCWNLPAVHMYSERTGYPGLYHYVRTYGKSHANRSLRQ